MPVSCTVARGPARRRNPDTQAPFLLGSYQSAALRERHGYAEITPQLRAKIFGLSAAKAYGLSAADVCFVRL